MHAAVMGIFSVQIRQTIIQKKRNIMIQKRYFSLDNEDVHKYINNTCNTFVVKS